MKRNPDLDALLGDKSESFDWRPYYFAVRERLWLVVLVFVLTLAGAVAYVTRAIPIYQSTAVMLIEQQRLMLIPGVQGVNTADLRYIDMMKTMVESIQSRTLYQRVIESLNLNENPQFIPRRPDGSSPSKEAAAGYLAGRVKATLRNGTRLIDVVAEHRDPEMARFLANSVANEFIRFGLEQRSSTTRMAHQFLLEEADRLRDKVRKSEQALQEYRTEHDAAFLDDKQDLVGTRLKSLNEQLSHAKEDRTRIESDFARVRQLGDHPDELMEIPSVASIPAVSQMSGAVAQKEADLAVIQLRYKAKHYRHIIAVAELDNFRARLREVLRSAGTAVEAAYNRAKETEDKLAKEVAEQEKLRFDLDQKAVDYNVLLNESKADQSLFESVLKSMKETDLTKGLDESPVKLVEPAVTSGIPVRPKKQQIVISSAAGGLILGLALAIGANFLFSGMRTVDYAEKTLNLPVLCAVPERERRRKPGELEVVNERHSSITEAFRSLRAAVNLLDRGSERRTLLVTSAVPGEGKTFISCSTAIVLAQSGCKTLLIDADLRKPSVSETVFGQIIKPGLTDVLLGKAKLEEVLLEGPVDGLMVVTAGSRTQHPSEILSETGFRGVLEEALLHFDRVVIDTAPVLAVSDTLTIARLADTICLAVYAAKTPGPASKRATHLLSEIGCRPDGVVMNRLAANAGYYYFGAYGKKEVYGAPRKVS